MLPIKINIDLDEVDTGNHWGDTIASLLKEAIECEIKAEVKKSVSVDESPSLF